MLAFPNFLQSGEILLGQAGAQNDAFRIAMDSSYGNNLLMKNQTLPEGEILSTFHFHYSGRNSVSKMRAKIPGARPLTAKSKNENFFGAHF